MNQISKQNKAKDKFSKIEMDFDDESLGYQVPKSSLMDIQTVSQKKTSGRVSNAVKITKLAFSSSVDVMAFIYGKILVPVISFSSKKIKHTAVVLKEREEELQIAVDKVLTEVEAKRKMQNEVVQSKVNVKNALINKYYEKMDTAFLGMIDSNKFDMDDQSHDIVKINLDLQMQTWGLISKKLIVSNMIANAKKIQIVTQQENDRLVTKMSMDMDKKGHMWSMMFGKHILPEIATLLADRDGKLKMKQTSNLTKGTDVFVLIMNTKVQEKIKMAEVNIPEIPASQEVNFMSDIIRNESVL